MNVKLTERSRIAIHRRLTAASDWGPGEEAIAVLAETWRTLNLSNLDGKAIDMTKLPSETIEYDLSDAAVGHLLVKMVSLPMAAGLALDVASVMEDLRRAKPKTT